MEKDETKPVASTFCLFDRSGEDFGVKFNKSIGILFHVLFLSKT
jgi:hypothetical protein